MGFSDKRRKQIAKFPKILGAPPDKPGDKWIGRWRIGEGADGKVFVWIKTDANDQVIQRMVEKRKHEKSMATKTDFLAALKAKQEGRPKHKPSNNFLATAYWWLHGGANPGEKPREAEIQRLLSDEESIAECYGYDVDKSRHVWRIYMEYVGNRNLEQLVEEEITRGETPKGFTPIPEPFCWYVLRELAKAALAMENPAQIEFEYPDMERPQVIHQDIKPANVFLGRPDPKYFPLYPGPRLGDFGLAQETWRNDTSDPIMSSDLPQFTAPELKRVKAGRRVPRRTPAANVCQIGLIIQYMMLAANDRMARRSGRPRPRGAHGVHSHMCLVGREDLIYSEHLIQVISLCTATQPHQRPSPQEILDVTESDPIYLQNMQYPAECQKPDKAKYWLIVPRELDEYRLHRKWKNKEEESEDDTSDSDDGSDEDDGSGGDGGSGGAGGSGGDGELGGDGGSGEGGMPGRGGISSVGGISGGDTRSRYDALRRAYRPSSDTDEDED